METNNSNNNSHSRHLEEEEEEPSLGYSKISLPRIRCLGDKLQPLLPDCLGMLLNRILAEASLEVNNKQLLYLIKVSNSRNSQACYLGLAWQILNLRIKDCSIQV